MQESRPGAANQLSVALELQADCFAGVWGNSTSQRKLLEQFEATFNGEDARKHSPKSATFIDGVKGFWDRMTS